MVKDEYQVLKYMPPYKAPRPDGF